MGIVAVTRVPSERLGECELSYMEREAIDVGRARAQHAAYVEMLRRAGAEVVILPALDEMADAVFVEDTAIVLDEVAIVAPMGAASRRGETEAIVDTLRAYRPVRALVAPATLDGGDVLHVGRTLFVGQTPRTNRAALEQLRAIVAPLGYAVIGVPVTKCLHFKSGCTTIGPETVLVNPEWVAPSVFGDRQIVTIDPVEPWGANSLMIRDHVVIPASVPRTRNRVERALVKQGWGGTVVEIDVSEFQKAEGGVTCMSILITT
jgi:dimethylargininase